VTPKEARRLEGLRGGWKEWTWTSNFEHDGMFVKKLFPKRGRDNTRIVTSCVPCDGLFQIYDDAPAMKPTLEFSPP
jgi:hypothetical protein